MTSAAVIGANGYVGTALCAALKKNKFVLTEVIRSNYAQLRQGTYDIVINAAMPSKRFWAENNPDADYQETVQKTKDLINGWKFNKFVQISTISARSQLDTVYGRNKAAAEKLCPSHSLIIRLGPMYGTGLKKGVLIDILKNQKVYVDGSSKYCFAPVEFATNWIACHLERTGITEVGAWNAIRLKEVADHIKSCSQFEGRLDHQEIPNPEADFPDAKQVFSFLDQMKKMDYDSRAKKNHSDGSRCR